jgi:hypothetical protein
MSKGYDGIELIVEHRQLEMWILIQEAVGAIEGA